MSSAPSAAKFWVLVRILAVSVNTLLVFGLTTLVAAFLVSCLHGNALATPVNFYLGIICGLIISLFISIFYIKRESISLPVHDPAAFLSRVRSEIEDLGYELKSTSPQHLQFKPPFQSTLLGGGFQVELKGDRARVTGPKVYLEKLRYRLRMQSHIGNVQKNAAEICLPVPGKCLQHVHLSLKIDGPQWQSLHQDVLALLDRLGAQVSCAMQFQVQCDQPSSTIELQVRDLIKKHGLQTKTSSQKPLPYLAPSSPETLPEFIAN